MPWNIEIHKRAHILSRETHGGVFLSKQASARRLKNLSNEELVDNWGFHGTRLTSGLLTDKNYRQEGNGRTEG